MEEEGEVILVFLNRVDKRNALSVALRRELEDCLASVAANEGVKVMVLSGRGS